MMMKKTMMIAFLTLASLSAGAQEKLEMEDIVTLEQVKDLTDNQLDSIDVRKKLVINDYTMIGIQYGAGVCRVNWNPRQEQDLVFAPYNFGITYTRYGKMFGYMPYFGFQTGIYFGQDAYQFKYNEEYDYTYKIEGAEKAVIDVIEVPASFQFHFDMWNFKIMAQLGCYAGYRLSIQRFPGTTGSVNTQYEHAFTPTDRRVDYGLKGGVGFGLVFDPIEIHFQATYKHALSSLYEPDHYSQYYYRFAYPSSLVISAGVHFQLTKRSGKTKASLRKEAKDLVYQINEMSNENTGSQGR